MRDTLTRLHSQALTCRAGFPHSLDVARMLRIQYPGALYHVVNRGDRGDAIVRDDRDRERFLQTLSEACAKTGWKVHAWCLLDDHFHLALTTPEPNLVAGMKWFLGTYTGRFNQRHANRGHLFSGRYRSQVVDPGTQGTLARLCAYIHTNPLRAGASEGPASLPRHVWSSLPSYLVPPEQRPLWLETSPLWSDLDLTDTDSGRDQLLSRTTAAAGPGAWDDIRTGWYLGSGEFRRQLLDRLQAQRTPASSGTVWRASEEQQAEKRVREAMDSLGWSDSELAARAKTDPEKLWIARQLRKETTMTITWIASRLQMGSRHTLRNALSSPAAGEVFRQPSPPVRPPQPPREPRQSKERPRQVPPSEPAHGGGSFDFQPGWD